MDNVEGDNCGVEVDEGLVDEVGTGLGPVVELVNVEVIVKKVVDMTTI